MKNKLLVFFSFFACAYSLRLSAQQVVLQGFWWDYANANYPDKWSNYVSEFAPRLKQLGIDAVWIPPSVKNGNLGNGYSPFDNYDLGDKYQKGFTGTRLGNKDELLRMVATLHANGVNVIQDLVLNHLDNAGSANGSGGQDPSAWDDFTTARYKNFRYTCYETPSTDEGSTDYLSRAGRFSKNWQNFHPNAADNSVSGNWNAVMFGPDISYASGASGQSSNAIYNPIQSADYMRDETRNWMKWYKKQVGFDGYRLDAVKHFPDYVMEDYLWNMQNNADWASGGEDMFAVGEYVGGASELDTYMSAVQNRAGTFDFSLRGAIYSMVTGNGNFDMGTIPAAQQTSRVFFQNGRWVHRTVPFVNNHDSFRPQVDANGNYTGWNSNNELVPHIDPFDARLSASYAIAFALDGSPVVFIEDLFDLGSTGNRYSHKPSSVNDLPVRDDIANIIWCHQNLHFKEGTYNVRYQGTDHLIIERSNKAIIGVNDQYSTWQNNYVQTSFAAGTVLKDYSGANGTATVTVDNQQGVNINTPPCDGSALGGRRGYSIWAPVGIVDNYQLTVKPTTQEWEMADDLGDSHSQSLGQGGSLPTNSTACRYIGSIFAEANTSVYCDLSSQLANATHQVDVYKNGVFFTSIPNVTGDSTFAFNAPEKNWYSFVVFNSTTTTVKHTIHFKVTYQGATQYEPNNYASLGNIASSITCIATSLTSAKHIIESSIINASIIENYLHVELTSTIEKEETIQLYNAVGQLLYNSQQKIYVGSNEFNMPLNKELAKGIYIVKLDKMGEGIKVVK